MGPNIKSTKILDGDIPPNNYRSYSPGETYTHDHIRLKNSSPHFPNYSGPPIGISATNCGLTGTDSVNGLTHQFEKFNIKTAPSSVLQHNIINMHHQAQTFVPQFTVGQYCATNGHTTVGPSVPPNAPQNTYGYPQMGGTTNGTIPVYSVSQPMPPLTHAPTPLYVEPVVSYSTYPQQVYQANNTGYTSGYVSEQYSQIPNNSLTTQAGQLPPPTNLSVVPQQVHNPQMPPPIHQISMPSLQPVAVPDQQNSALPPGLYPVFIPIDSSQQFILPSDNKLVTCGQHFNPLTDSANMEIVWNSWFSRLFSQLGSWTLIPLVDDSDIIKKQFYSANDSAKVRFLCQNCCNAWTSMKGRIQFFYRLSPDNTGVVYFQLYGQQCKKCMPKEFEHSMWYPEEVYKVLLNLYHKVANVIYGAPLQTLVKERRAGRPRTEHNSSLCQACSMGACREKRNGEL